jgi:hypothetical protein
LDVGIGVESPTHQLDVAGTVAITSDMDVDGSVNLLASSSISWGRGPYIYSPTGGSLEYNGASHHIFTSDIQATAGTFSNLSALTPVFADTSKQLTSTGSYGAMYISSAASTTCTSAGTYYKVAGTYTTTQLSNFSLETGNSLKYTGATTQKFLVTVSLSAYSNSTTAYSHMYFQLAKNDVVDSTTKQRRTFVNSTANIGYPVSLSQIVSLAQNEFVNLYVAHSLASKTVTVDNMNMQIVPLGL